VSEKEKLQLENDELVLEDISSNNCQQETTKKIKKNKKRIKEIEEKENDTLEETTETKE
jgi:rRNA processing protein Krr1/Pno1